MGARHLHDRGEVTAGFVIGFDHLRQARHLAHHQIVGEQHGKRFVADELARAPDGMAEAERGLLARVGDLPRLRQARFELLEHVFLAALAQGRLELEGAVEMIVDRALAPARDKEELLDPGRLGLLDRVMNERLVDDRQHLFRHRLGRRQEPGSQPGDRKNGLANWFVHELLDRVPVSHLRLLSPHLDALLD